MAFFSSSPVAAPPSQHWNNLFDAHDLPSSPFGSSSFPKASTLHHHQQQQPQQQTATFGNQHLTVQTTSSSSHGRDGDEEDGGELSPSFDASFAQSMNISRAASSSSSAASEHDSCCEEHDGLHLYGAAAALPPSPHAMDISPAPPTNRVAARLFCSGSPFSTTTATDPPPGRSSSVRSPLQHLMPHAPRPPTTTSTTTTTTTKTFNASGETGDGSKASIVMSPSAGVTAAKRSSSSSASSTRTSTPTLFDQSFFGKLSANRPSPIQASSKSNRKSGSIKGDIPGDSRPTLSAFPPLSDKNVNTFNSTASAHSSSTTADRQSGKHRPVFALKKPPSLLRTASAAPAIKHATDPASHSAGNLFQHAAPVAAFPARPTALFLDRAKSDNQLAFGGSSHATDVSRVRKPSRLSKETSLDVGAFGTAQNENQRPSFTSHGRKISGSSRVRSCLPAEWSQSKTAEAGAAGSAAKAPRLHHTVSAPNARPEQWASVEVKQNSESAIPTQRTLATEYASSRPVRQILQESSPSAMDIDMSSPRFGSAQQSRSIMVGSPGLGDLFEENGVDLSSPLPGSPGGTGPLLPPTRKRAMEDPDSSMEQGEGHSFTLSSPVLLSKTDSQGAMAALSGPGGLGSRALSRPASSASLNSGISRRRGGVPSPFATMGASSGSSTLAKDPDSSSSSRHRKMSRGCDGRPNLLKGRRTHSMCDSEFYASPPLETANLASQPKTKFRSMTESQPDSSGDDVVETLAEPADEHDTMGDYFATAPPTRPRSADVLSPPPAPAAPEEVITLQSPPTPRVNKSNLGSYQPSPEASFTSGFGHKEALGKILPCFPVKEDGLMRITASTLNDLLTGVYDDAIDQYVVIDCRFDYEYKGGHVEGAINLATSKAVEDFLLGTGDDSLYAAPEEMPPPSKSGEADATGNPRKTILVFHCEFSCKRAPTLAKHLRSRDRALNHAAYPAIHYPELYILQGGYAECYKSHPERCEPCGYVQMDDPRHLAARANDLIELRRKRLGTRAKSYTFGENLFAKPSYTKHLSVNAPPARPISSSGGSGNNNLEGGNRASTLPTTRPTMSRPPSLSAALFGGNAANKNAALCVHEEEKDEDASSSPAGGDHSFSGTRVTAAAAAAVPKPVNLMSSLAGDDSSPCSVMGSAADLASSNLQMMTGFSPCPSKSKTAMEAMASSRPQLMRPPSLTTAFANARLDKSPQFPPVRTSSFARTLQRTSTSATVTFSR